MQSGISRRSWRFCRRISSSRVSGSLPALGSCRKKQQSYGSTANSPWLVALCATPRRSDGPVLSRTVVSEEDALDARADGLIVQDRSKIAARCCPGSETMRETRRRCDALELIGVGEEVGVRADVGPSSSLSGRRRRPGSGVYRRPAPWPPSPSYFERSANWQRRGGHPPPRAYSRGNPVGLARRTTVIVARIEVVVCMAAIILVVAALGASRLCGRDAGILSRYALRSGT